MNGMTGIMNGKRGLIMGVANNHSIAWGIAQKLAGAGAELAFTYQGEALGKRVKPLAAELGSDFVIPCDVEDIASVDATIDAIKEKWGKLDFVVHAIGFSDKNELKGLYADTSRDNFTRTMVISCFSFTEIAKRAADLMTDGGSMLTLTYGGSTRIMPNYNVMGVANQNSIAWGIAKALAAQGAQLAFTYQGEALGKRVKPLAAELGSDFVIPCDVEDLASVDATIEAIKEKWGKLDFVVHAIGFSDKNELKGLYADTTRDNFSRTMVISCFSFTEIAKRAADLMTDGGAMLTLTYGGSTRIMPNYNVMGVAKAALEASVRYLAGDYGPQGIRVNAISAGPIRTLAGAGISDARAMLSWQQKNAPLRRTVTIEDVGNSALYLLSDLSSGVTGEIHYVDAGYNITSMPTLERLAKADSE